MITYPKMQILVPNLHLKQWLLFSFFTCSNHIIFSLSCTLTSKYRNFAVAYILTYNSEYQPFVSLFRHEKDLANKNSSYSVLTLKIPFSFRFDLVKGSGYQENTCSIKVEAKYSLRSKNPLVKNVLGPASVTGNGNLKASIGSTLLKFPSQNNYINST